MRYLVTGATGALGSAVVRLLAHRDAEVRALVRDPTGFEGRPTALPAELVVGDALVPADVRRAARSCDAVLHCVGPPLTRHERAVDAVDVLANAVPDDAHVVYPGRTWVFGEATGTVRPGTSMEPNSRLARLEARAVERLAESRLRSTVVFLPDCYGPFEDGPVSRRLVRPAVEGRDVRFPAPVDVPHEFCYVDDAARAMVAVAGEGVAVGRRYVVGATRGVTVREFVDLVREAAGTDGRVRRLPDSLFRLAGLVSEQARALAGALAGFRHEARLDGSAIREDVGFSPRVDYEEGAERTVAWHRGRREVPVEQ